MTPSASAAAWRRPANKSRGWRRGIGVAVVALVAVVVSQYLAGYALLWSLDRDPARASPLTVARYAHYYGHRPVIRQRLWLTSGLGLAVVLAGTLAFVLPRRRALHGDARFADRGEIRRAGLLGDHGIILGRLGGRCLMLPGQQGVALAAPPRAGKGTGVVVPNLLNWPDSLICIDIKRENWTLTAGFRKAAGQACYLFDPFAEDGATARWNPFFYVSADPLRRVNDLQRIAEMLYPDPPNVDPFWTASARSLFLGIALYLFETPSMPKTIGEVLRQGMASDDEGFGAHWKRVIEGRNSGRYPLSPQCVRALYDVIDLAPVTASSIRKTFTSRLDLWLNPILDAATSGNDFDLRELRRQHTSIYVGVNPDDLHRLRPVLSLFFQQAIGLQTRALPEHDPSLKLQVLMMLDEFTALGRIPIIAEAVSYLPGYNVRVVLVIQTPAQLREVYGANGAETMLKTLAARIVFAPKDFPDAREISDELGFTTVKVSSLSKPVFDFSDAKGRRQRSVSVSEQRRALLLPQEVKELGTEEAIIFYEGMRPIRCNKICYFEDARFRARLLPPPKVTGIAPIPRETPPDAGAPGGVNRHVSGNSDAGPATRVATQADLDRIETLTLEDFAVDFSKVEIPVTEPGQRLSAQEMDGVVDSFLASLQGGGRTR
ncbi:MAG: type IV secretory system conjugative DNA transfer family protein [Chloroflexota bacterium]|nr:type IV secretory system conjugative DNA transfer family protein [Chloroflexota bacterium]